MIEKNKWRNFKETFLKKRKTEKVTTVEIKIKRRLERKKKTNHTR